MPAANPSSRYELSSGQGTEGKAGRTDKLEAATFSAFKRSLTVRNHAAVSAVILQLSSDRSPSPVRFFSCCGSCC